MRDQHEHKSDQSDHIGAISMVTLEYFRRCILRYGVGEIFLGHFFRKGTAHILVEYGVVLSRVFEVSDGFVLAFRDVVSVIFDHFSFWICEKICWELG